MRAQAYLSCQFHFCCKEPPRPSSPSNERRRGLRSKHSRPVKIYEPQSSRYFPGQTADISATGLRLTPPLSTPLIPGNVLSLHIGSPHSTSTLASRRQMLEAKVIWMHRDRSELVVGLELLSTAAIQSSAA